MQTRLNPYLSFDNNTREAMQFYQTVFGGELQMVTFKDAQASQDPSQDSKIMHSQLEAENGITFMASDGMDHRPGTNMRISLSGDNEAELTSYWGKLSVGANIQVPLEPASWGDAFGMLTDKFGVDWMVNISGQKA